MLRKKLAYVPRNKLASPNNVIIMLTIFRLGRYFNTDFSFLVSCINNNSSLTISFHANFVLSVAVYLMETLHR